MKITKSQLKQIIKEELKNVLESSGQTAQIRHPDGQTIQFQRFPGEQDDAWENRKKHAFKAFGTLKGEDLYFAVKVHQQLQRRAAAGDKSAQYQLGQISEADYFKWFDKQLKARGI
jgi:hypothetical protein